MRLHVDGKEYRVWDAHSEDAYVDVMIPAYLGVMRERRACWRTVKRGPTRDRVLAAARKLIPAKVEG